MKCPLCNLEMRIKRSKKVIEGDPPIEYRVQDLSCMNRNCENFDKIVATVKTKTNNG